MKYLFKAVYVVVRLVIILTIWPLLHLLAYIVVSLWEFKPMPVKEWWELIERVSLLGGESEWDGSTYEYDSWKNYLLGKRTITGNVNDWMDKHIERRLKGRG